jgi:hypothetical protein
MAKVLQNASSNPFKFWQLMHDLKLAPAKFADRFLLPVSTDNHKYRRDHSAKQADQVIGTPYGNVPDCKPGSKAGIILRKRTAQILNETREFVALPRPISLSQLALLRKRIEQDANL